MINRIKKNTFSLQWNSLECLCCVIKAGIKIIELNKFIQISKNSLHIHIIKLVLDKKKQRKIVQK